MVLLKIREISILYILNSIIYHSISINKEFEVNDIFIRQFRIDSESQREKRICWYTKLRSLLN